MVRIEEIAEWANHLSVDDSVKVQVKDYENFRVKKSEKARIKALYPFIVCTTKGTFKYTDLYLLNVCGVFL